MSRTDIIPGVSIPSALVANLYDKNAEPDDKLAQQVAQEQIIYVIEARGGDDKNVHGHVAGAVATANKIIDAQINSAPIFYAWKDHEEVKATLMQPNVIGAVLMTGTVLPEYSQAKLDGLMAEFKAAGKLVGASIYEAGVPERYSTKLPNPEGAKYKLAVIEFVIPGAKNGGSDKGPDGHRVDSIPIANGIIKAGGSCDLIRYEFDKHDAFAAEVEAFDAVLVRINPGQLSQGTTPGTQQRFDDLMNSLLAKGKLVWSSPGVQTCMGAKDALVKINHMSVGLPDTFAYYEKSELEAGFKKTCAFQPRVIKQNRGSAGEGIWLCWLEGKDYCTNFGDAMLEDDDKLKLMEMNDNHVEYHTVKEFITFCVEGPDAEGAGEWKSTFPGKYLEGGKAAGGQLVDQRLLPRISEGEVRMLMVGPVLQMIIHKKPEGGLSAVGGNSAYTYFKPGCKEYETLERKFIDEDIPQLMKALEIENDPLPILWTGDFIPRDGDTPGSTEYVVGEFNCSCVGISKFQAVCGGEQTLADVSDADYYEACELTDLMGTTAIMMLDQKKASA